MGGEYRATACRGLTTHMLRESLPGISVEQCVIDEKAEKCLAYAKLLNKYHDSEYCCLYVS